MRYLTASLPHCLGEVGTGNVVMHCHAASGPMGRELLECTRPCPGAVQRNLLQCTATLLAVELL